MVNLPVKSVTRLKFLLASIFYFFFIPALVNFVKLDKKGEARCLLWDLNFFGLLFPTSHLTSHLLISKGHKNSVSGHS